MKWITKPPSPAKKGSMLRVSRLKVAQHGTALSFMHRHQGLLVHCMRHFPCGTSKAKLSDLSIFSIPTPSP